MNLKYFTDKLRRRERMVARWTIVAVVLVVVGIVLLLIEIFLT